MEVTGNLAVNISDLLKAIFQQHFMVKFPGVFNNGHEADLDWPRFASQQKIK